MGSAAGLTAAGLKGLHAAAERHVGDEKVPGLVALVARGGQVHVEALGRLAVGGLPVARDSIFRIASTTKPITAAATLAVASEGLIGLDEPVDRLLPELAGRQVLRRMDGPLDDTVPAARAITTRILAANASSRGRTCSISSGVTTDRRSHNPPDHRTTHLTKHY
jgi:CubicO group peptidase (beta-lactamase class C family)